MGYKWRGGGVKMIPGNEIISLYDICDLCKYWIMRACRTSRGDE